MVELGFLFFESPVRVTDEIHIILIARFLVIQLADIFNLKEETTASELTRTKAVGNGLSELGLFIISAVLSSSIRFYALPLVLFSNSLFLYRYKSFCRDRFGLQLQEE